jgi:hypothetical protein
MLTVIGVTSDFPDDDYHDSDVLLLDDHLGINYSIPFKSFALTRQDANSPSSSQYYASRADAAYGMAVTGIVDTDGSSLPISVATAPTVELPEIDEDSDTRPPAATLNLTVTVSNLVVGQEFVFCVFSDIASVRVFYMSL